MTTPAVILTALAAATIAGAACSIAMFKRGRLGTPRHMILGIVLNHRPGVDR
jgi:hypothetical protein